MSVSSTEPCAVCLATAGRHVRTLSYETDAKCFDTVGT